MYEARQDRIVGLKIPLVATTHLYSSGYILGNGLILTCRHSFISDKGTQFDNGKPIKIVSQGFEGEIQFQGKTLNDLIEEQVIIFTSEKYDIALLSCKAVADFEEFHLEELNTAGTWECGGYPVFNHKGKNTSGYKNFDGTFTAVEHNGIYLYLMAS